MLQIRAYELLYGGARGGAKTETGIIWLLSDEYHKNPLYRALVVRRNSDDLRDWVDRADRIFSALGAVKTGTPATFTFPSGAKIVTGHLKDSDAYTKYQGHEYQRILIEELTQIKNELDYEKLIASCRSSVPGLIPGIFNTTNPTGKGHSWVKNRFVKIDGVNMAYKVWIPEKTKRPRVFIPSTVYDNPILLKSDPGYLDFLKGLPAHLMRAWLKGDWDIGAGQFFDTWRHDVHVCAPFEIPSDWKKFICFDQGYSAPSAVYWNAIEPETGKVYTYRELYRKGLTYLQLIDTVAQMTPLDEHISWIVADSAIWAKNAESGESGADTMFNYLEKVKWHVQLIPCNKGKDSRIRGWTLVREYLLPKPNQYGILVAKWQIFTTCKELIRVMPEQMYNDTKSNLEDLDTEGEDHAPDAMRYGFQSVGMSIVDLPDREAAATKKKKGLTAEEQFKRLFPQP